MENIKSTKYCNKFKYTDKLDAMIWKWKSSNMPFRKGYWPLKRVYWCNDCKSYHLTSMSKFRKK